MIDTLAAKAAGVAVQKGQQALQAYCYATSDIWTYVSFALIIGVLIGYIIAYLSRRSGT